ncbi:DUF1934 domain-containing protein [Virgibacillus sp. W0430]|uniref:DUF1934 domain-containing protein n=1 Tax=Virgibacillus sp. W0430 TaxID=3391580 RepID=UPI003F446665
MKRIKKKVKVNLHSIINDEGNEEHNHVLATGTFHKTGTISVLTFDENSEENGTIKNLITIHANKVNIKRTGVITMNQQFRLHKKTESQLQHPYGKMGMETFTHTLVYKPIDETSEGELFISYQVKLNGQAKRDHQLKLIFTEEETH